jgi:quercetin dioxygenase-like cupin family protein
LIVRDYQTISKDKHPVLNGVGTRSLRNLKGKVVKDLDLRIFEVQPGTDNPLHTHAYSHDLFVIRGTGLVRLEDREQRVGEGDVVFITSYEPHAFVNDSDEALQFLCMDCTVIEP